MQRVGLAYLGALVAIGAAGCGGGESHGSYTLPATRSCLNKAGFQTAVVANRFFPNGGNLRVKLSNAVPLLNPNAPTGTVLDNTFVFLVFTKDPAAAVETEGKAVGLALRSLTNSGLLVTRASLKAGMQVTWNVFYYSPTGALTDTERGKVSSCLR